MLASGDLLCFAAFWDDDPRSVLFFSDWEHGQQCMVQAAWDLLDQADIVVHYNGRKFDVPWLQRKFAEFGLTPPSPYRQVDLYRVVEREFAFPSNKLAYIAERLLGMKKIKTNFDLWVRVRNGEAKAQKEMRRYCIRDTRILRPLHWKLIPWMSSYPNLVAIGSDGPVCKCGSTNLEKRGFAYTQSRAYQQYRCRDCGSWPRDTRCVPGMSAQVTPGKIN